jgi:hypothetical protein
MAFTKFTNLDYDQIRASVKDYLRANSDFTGFDFEGSNFSVLVDTLAYNAYINSVNANMIVNESFLDSATLRRNVVSLAGNIGYLPMSTRAAVAKVTFTVSTTVDTPTLTLKAGLVAVGAADDTDFLFSVPNDITTTVEDGVAVFGTVEEPIEIFQGTYLQKAFAYDGSLDQRFILSNNKIDYTTLRVFIQDQNEQGRGNMWNRSDNIIGIKDDSEIFYLSEVDNEYYELIFGDGIFGKKLQQGQTVNSSYIVTDGKDGNGPSRFSFTGSIASANGVIITSSTPVVITTLEASRNGTNIETIQSVKYYAPKQYAAQYRAVTARDYEAIIKEVYPNTESVSVVGGEELDPPQFGNIIISIKPSNGTDVSDFDKTVILEKLKQYTIAGMNQKIVDLKILFVELESAVYYNETQTPSANSLKAEVIRSLETYSSSIDLNKFGGRFKYSKAQKVIDDTSMAITSNISRVLIRRNLAAALDTFAQYELCFGNGFYIIPGGGSIKSTGFQIFGNSQTIYLTDIPNTTASGALDGSGKGKISFISEKFDAETGNVGYTVVVDEAGVIDYTKGEIQLFTTRISSTNKPNRVIEVQAYPQSNDVLGLKDLYVSFDVSASEINMVRDTISSGEQISGVGFSVTSSYGNGKLTR